MLLVALDQAANPNDVHLLIASKAMSVFGGVPLDGILFLGIKLVNGERACGGEVNVAGHPIASLCMHDS